MCGQISIAHLPEGIKQLGRYKVMLSAQGRDEAVIRTIESNHQGVFCFQAKPGDYSIQVLYCSHVGITVSKPLKCPTSRQGS